MWDLDGTIIDSENYWITAEIELANRFDAIWTHQDGLWQVGQGLPVTAQALINKGVQLPIPEVIDELGNRVLELLRDAIPWRPGALALLQELSQLGIPQALVTMSVDAIAQFIAMSMPGVHFDFIVSGDSAEEQKPHPAPYLQAARGLGCDIRECLVVEDSPSGVTSAASAGACVIGVTHLVSLEDVQTSRTWPTLSGRTVLDLSDVFESRAEPQP